MKVVRSKTAIVPINSSLLPRTDEELERCRRTAYVTNLDIDLDVRLCRPGCALRPTLIEYSVRLFMQGQTVYKFFEQLCGNVTRVHVTKMQGQQTLVAFVEFATEESADKALNCIGARIKVKTRCGKCVSVPRG
jgi:RNA recognition motif-containing protein